jgi:hypothetical protein
VVVEWKIGMRTIDKTEIHQKVAFVPIGKW